MPLCTLRRLTEQLIELSCPYCTRWLSSGLGGTGSSCCSRGGGDSRQGAEAGGHWQGAGRSSSPGIEVEVAKERDPAQGLHPKLQIMQLGLWAIEGSRAAYANPRCLDAMLRLSYGHLWKVFSSILLPICSPVLPLSAGQEREA